MRTLLPIGLAALCGCTQLQPPYHPRDEDCRVAAEAMAGIVDSRARQAMPNADDPTLRAPVLSKSSEQVLNERMMDWDLRASARPSTPAKVERERAYYNNQLIVTHAYARDATAWTPLDRAQAVDVYVRDCKAAKIKIWTTTEARPPAADLI